MSNEEDLQDTLAHWRQQHFRDDTIPLESVVKSLETEEPLAQAKPSTSSSRWMLFKPGTKKLLTFCHVFVWQWSNSLETGNFIPPGEEFPLGVTPGKMTRFPGMAAYITYVFDTKLDTSFQDNMLKLEKVIKEQAEFDQRHMIRKTWQNHQSDVAQNRYQVTANLFIKRPRELDRPKLPYSLHPWMQAVVETGKTLWFPHPDRPRYFEAAESGVINLEEANVSKYSCGDIVWVAFRIGIVLSANTWHTELIPLEFVRVGRVPETTFDGSTWQTDPDYNPMISSAMPQLQPYISGPVPAPKCQDVKPKTEHDVISMTASVQDTSSKTAVAQEPSPKIQVASKVDADDDVFMAYKPSNLPVSPETPVVQKRKISPPYMCETPTQDGPSSFSFSRPGKKRALAADFFTEETHAGEEKENIDPNLPFGRVTRSKGKNPASYHN